MTYRAQIAEEHGKVTIFWQIRFYCIDAYFSLTEKDDSALEELKKWLEKIFTSTRNVIKQLQKRIIFAEIDYRSILRVNRESRY